jgi:hypothetical protein
MMTGTNLGPWLRRRKINLPDAIKEACLSDGDAYHLDGLDQCAHCNIWYNAARELKPDLDESLICRFCEDNYGK